MKSYKIFGVGFNDLTSEHPAYTVWHSIHRRAYSEVYQKGKPTYIDVEVCEEWQKLSNFASWYKDNYREGFQLDKDLIKQGNRIYCPEYCCFLPNEINCALSYKSKNGLPPGVSWRTQSNAYVAQVSRNTEDGKRKTIWLGTFGTVEDAFNAYKPAKESYIKELAEKWKDRISEAAYVALLSYEINWSK